MSSTAGTENAGADTGKSVGETGALPFLSSNLILSATISVVYLFAPVWSVQLLLRSFPSTKIWAPFFMYFSESSAKFLQHTILCHSVWSCNSPALFLNLSVVAKVKDATAVPVSRCLTSGSFPTFPISITLLNDIA